MTADRHLIPVSRADHLARGERHRHHAPGQRAHACPGSSAGSACAATASPKAKSARRGSPRRHAAAAAIAAAVVAAKRSGRARLTRRRSSTSTNAASRHHSANLDRRRQVDSVREAERRLRLAALHAERDELMQLRETDVINDEVLRTIQSDLDHAESLVAGPAARPRWTRPGQRARRRGAAPAGCGDEPLHPRAGDTRRHVRPDPLRTLAPGRGGQDGAGAARGATHSRGQPAASRRAGRIGHGPPGDDPARLQRICRPRRGRTRDRARRPELHRADARSVARRTARAASRAADRRGRIRRAHAVVALGALVHARAFRRRRAARRAPRLWRCPPRCEVHWQRRLTTDPARLERTLAGSIVRVEVTPQPIAASAIRAALARGPEGRAEIRGLLPAAVLDYIDRNQLYLPHSPREP